MKDSIVHLFAGSIDQNSDDSTNCFIALGEGLQLNVVLACPVLSPRLAIISVVYV